MELGTSAAEEECVSSGKYNIAVGFLVIAGFSAYGFLLIYLRDFAPDKDAWVASYSVGKHFESRLAHVHGNLFALLNIVVGVALPRISTSARSRAAIGGLALAGLMMPIGILAEVYVSAPPLFVIVGGVAMLAAVSWAGVAALRGATETKAAE